ncbi:hypothetical protein D3C87_1726900 [compost metagenome]
MLTHQLQGLFSTGKKGRRDRVAGHGQHLRMAIEYFTALPSGNLRGWPRRRQAAGDFRAQHHQPALLLPVCQLVERPAALAVITYGMAQKAGTDQYLLHTHYPRRRYQPVIDSRSRLAANTSWGTSPERNTTRRPPLGITSCSAPSARYMRNAPPCSGSQAWLR